VILLSSSSDIKGIGGFFFIASGLWASAKKKSTSSPVLERSGDWRLVFAALRGAHRWS